MWNIDDGAQYLSPDNPEERDAVENGYGAGGFNAGLPQRETTWIAWIKLCFCSLGFVFGIYILWRFFKYRNVLEIRARSSYLVLTVGICLLLELTMHIHVECIRLFDVPITLLPTHLLYFFVTFTVDSCYFCRVIRLGVAFSPLLKKNIPWIMSQQLLITLSVCIGLASLAIPIYYYEITTGECHLLRFAIAEHRVVWKVQVALTAIQLAMLPIVWVVDDIFRISWELIVIIFVALVDAAATKIAENTEMPPRVQMFINSSNFGIISTSILFGLSLVDPIRRLTFNPLAKPATSIISARSRNGRLPPNDRRVTVTDLTVSTGGNVSWDDDRGMDSTPSSISADQSTGSQWSYDKMTTMPAVAEAFRVFAWRALCQESVMFLEEVTKYSSGNYTIGDPVKSQFSAFNTIVGRFIVDNSVDEINIRTIFQPAFLEIRSMLEVNLLHRFMETEGFRSVWIQSPTRLGHSRTQSTGARSSASTAVMCDTPI